MWLDQDLTVLANTVYANPVGGTPDLVGKDVEVSLPEVTSKTVEAVAMGTMDVPVIGQFDNMEMSVHHIGIDLGLAKMLAQETLEIEIRWVDQIMQSGGSQKPVSCKAFFKAFPKVAVPSFSVKPGESVDVEVPYTVTGYKLVKDGDVLFDIDRLAQRFIINGKDYFAEMSSML